MNLGPILPISSFPCNQWSAIGVIHLIPGTTLLSYEAIHLNMSITLVLMVVWQRNIMKMLVQLLMI